MSIGEPHIDGPGLMSALVMLAIPSLAMLVGLVMAGFAALDRIGAHRAPSARNKRHLLWGCVLFSLGGAGNIALVLNW